MTPFNKFEAYYLLQLITEAYEKRTNKEILDNLVVTALLLILSIRSIGLHNFNLILSIVNFCLYLLSTFFTLYIVRRLARNQSKYKLSKAFSYSILEKMQLTIIFTSLWLAGLSLFFEASQEGVFAIKSLSAILISFCLIAILASPIIIKSKSLRVKNGKQAQFIKATSIGSTLFGSLSFLYFVFLTRVHFSGLDFIIAVLANFLSWLLMPNLTWNLCELMFLGFTKWSKEVM